MPAFAVAELSAAAVVAITSVVILYLLLVSVVALTAVFHGDSDRRADARRVLTALLAVVPRKRAAGRRALGTARPRKQTQPDEPDL